MFKLDYTLQSNPLFGIYYKSYAFANTEEIKEQHKYEIVRISNKFFKTNFKTFSEWEAAAKYDTISDLLLQLTYHYEVTIDGIYSDQWSRLDATLNSYAKKEDQIKVKICFGRCLLDAIVHLYNYLEIFRKEYIKEELSF